MPKPETLTPPIPRMAVGMKEAAESLGVSRSHLYNLLNDGELHTIMIGGRRLIRVAELERFINSRTNTPTIAK